MAYIKPGIEVTQQQTTNTPVLTTPDLEACIVGNSYYWQDPSDDSAIVNVTLDSGSSKSFNLKDQNSSYYDVKKDESLVVVDLLGISGPDSGTIKHLISGADFSVDSNIVGTQITISGNTINASSKYQVRVGYRAKNTVATDGFKTVISIADAEETLGKAVSWNPLSFGVLLAMMNSNATMKVLKISPDADTMTAINDTLSLQDIYVIAPMTHDVDEVALATHCDTNSLPINKKERIAFVNLPVNYTTFDSTATTKLSETIRDKNAIIDNKRIYAIHPDAGYITETRHISTISPSWIDASFANSTKVGFITDVNKKMYAKFISDITLNGVKYKAGDLITQEVFNTILNSGWGGSTGLVTVSVPVPGYYYCAMAAGKVISTAVSQPLTNVPCAGISQTFGSQDIFTEAMLNTMASGGTWIMTQDNPQSAVYCRHQKSTSMTSIAQQELSVVKAVDYTAKFARKGLKAYIGKYNITPAYLTLIDTILNGQARFLVKTGVLQDMKVSSVKQGTDSDATTVFVDVNITVLYPVNYIKITLIF